MTDDLITTKGLKLEDLGVGDIVTLQPRSDNKSWDAEIFEVRAATSTNVVLKIRWPKDNILTLVGRDQIIVRRAAWTFVEASELLESVSPGSPDLPE